jgi:hypothetical protein
VYQYVYVSSEAFKFSDDQLMTLMENSRRRNLACDVTGLLLYLSGNFIQLLEGSREDVLATVTRIKADTRHRGINTLLDASCENRDFKNWSMGFERVEGEAGAQIPGYSDFLSRDTTQLAKNSAALRLLSFFKKMAG